MLKRFSKKIPGISWLTRARMIMLLTAAATLFIFQGWFGPSESAAAITAAGAWTSVNDTNPNIAAVNVNAATQYTAQGSAGTNRVVMIGIAAGSVATNTITSGSVVVKMGTVTATRINGNEAIAGRVTTWLGYIPEGAIPAGAQTINVTYTGSAATTSLKVYCATYAGVDQANPIVTSAQAARTAVANTPSATALAMTFALGDQSVMITGNSVASTVSSYTPAIYTQSVTTSGNTMPGYVASRSTTTVAAAEGTNVTFSVATGYPAFTIVALHMFTSTLASCGSCHGYPPVDGTRSGTTGQFVGSHNTHAGSAATAGQYGFACSVCHYNYPLNDPNYFKHSTGYINITGSRLPGNSYTLTDVNHKKAVSNAPAFGTCSAIYCHSAGTGGISGDGRPIAGVTSPVWGSGTTTCTSCHATPPGYANNSPKKNSHSTGGHAITCENCHDSVTYSAGTYTPVASLHVNQTYNIKSTLGYTYNAGGGSCATAGCHGLAQWGVTVMDCVSCHSIAITRTLGRPGTQLSQIAGAGGEFGLAWGHKKSGRATVTAADCIVCHLEGEYATGKPSATYHKNGNIDLRDPDGAGETPITNISGTAFTFQRFSTSYATGTRTATGHTSNTDIANVLTQKFCLPCHDSNGATNPTARSNNGGTGTAAMPFGGIALGAAYIAANNAIGTQGLIDVKTQTLTTNASAHPIQGPRNRAYPITTFFKAPYNNFTRTAGTKSNGVVLNCFDCHNTPTPLTTSTIVAHGNAVTLRGNIWANPASLCIVCHTPNVGSPTGGQHGAGSAFNSNTNSGMQTYITNRCEYCHSSSTASPGRPIRAQDVHGFDRFAGSGTDTMWPIGATNTYKPYAFFRNVTNWTTTSWKPLSGPSVTTGSATCGGSSTASSGCTGENMSTYTPGGAY